MLEDGSSRTPRSSEFKVALFARYEPSAFMPSVPIPLSCVSRYEQQCLQSVRCLISRAREFESELDIYRDIQRL